MNTPNKQPRPQTGRKNNKPSSSSHSQNSQWRRMDIHLHTPASNDYQEPLTSYLDILRQAERRSLDIIAFTDHNSVAGIQALQEEIKKLLFLEELNRITPEEARQLAEYRRLQEKILVLPGFEFTATFGFHILGIFPPNTPVNFLEHLLLSLNIPANLLKEGSSTVGSTSDVLTAYRVINQAGGLVIAAHVNTSNGVLMRDLDFGGQTRIAFTQDPNLHLLEVTDLEKRGRYTTRRFFDGSKPEYPRAMRCIQNSDAHRLIRDPNRPKSLGIGDRITEIRLPEVSFEALATVLKGPDLSLTRPYYGPAPAVDFIQLAREEGESLVQSFHNSMTQRGGYFNRILEDICAMANTNGGTIYVGASANAKKKLTGVREPKKSIEKIQTDVANRITPCPEITVDQLRSQGTVLLRITIQPGKELPYAIDDNQFFIRQESETTLAVRDEIVQLVQRSELQEVNTISAVTPFTQLPPMPPLPEPTEQRKTQKTNTEPALPDLAPRTGVEVVATEQRKGKYYHMVRDLRNGNLIKNVTRASARKLWHYAISQSESNHVDPKKIKWHKDMALIGVRQKDDFIWYDLALKSKDQIHFYFGVTDNGLNNQWLELIEKETGKKE